MATKELVRLAIDPLFAEESLSSVAVDVVVLSSSVSETLAFDIVDVANPRDFLRSSFPVF